MGKKKNYKLHLLPIRVICLADPIYFGRVVNVGRPPHVKWENHTVKNLEKNKKGTKWAELQKNMRYKNKKEKTHTKKLFILKWKLFKTDCWPVPKCVEKLIILLPACAREDKKAMRLTFPQKWHFFFFFGVLIYFLNNITITI